VEAEIEPKVQHRAILFAILAAALYAISSPVSKLLLKEVPPTFMASFLYLGAGIGMALVGLVRTVNGIESGEKRLTTKEIPYTVGYDSFRHCCTDIFDDWSYHGNARKCLFAQQF